MPAEGGDTTLLKRPLDTSAHLCYSCSYAKPDALSMLSAGQTISHTCDGQARAGAVPSFVGSRGPARVSQVSHKCPISVSQMSHKCLADSRLQL